MNSSILVSKSCYDMLVARLGPKKDKSFKYQFGDDDFKTTIAWKNDKLTGRDRKSGEREIKFGTLRGFAGPDAKPTSVFGLLMHTLADQCVSGEFPEAWLDDGDVMEALVQLKPVVVGMTERCETADQAVELFPKLMALAVRVAEKKAAVVVLRA